MMKKPVKKKDTMAARVRAKAVEDSMKVAPTRRATAMDKPPSPPPSPPPAAAAAMASMPRKGAPPAMATPPDMSAPAGMAPPGGAPMGMKKGGAVKMKSGGKAPPKKGGVMIMIAMGKKKGR
jgi:hypothetical protein